MIDNIKEQVRELRKIRLGWAEKVTGVESVGQTWEPFADGPGEAMWIPTPGQDSTVLLYRGERNSIFDMHSHQSCESVIVLGKAELLIDGSHRVMENGDTVEIGSMTRHGWALLEDSVLLLAWTPGFPVDPADESRVLWGADPSEVQKFNHDYQDA